MFKFLKNAIKKIASIVSGWWKNRVNVIVHSLIAADTIAANYGLTRPLRRILYGINFAIGVIAVASGLHIFTFISITGSVVLGFMVWMGSIPAGIVGIKLTTALFIGIPKMVLMLKNMFSSQSSNVNNYGNTDYAVLLT